MTEAMTDEKLIEWASAEIDTIYEPGGVAYQRLQRLIALARIGLAVTPPTTPQENE